ncbi:MAG: hypothetical protein IJ493_02855 [Clostridia bacterium]|nr:hypothetical protein [Clostridia bacterium]
MLSIPLINEKSTNETRPLYLSELKRAGADRVFIFIANPHDPTELDHVIGILRENIDFYRANGIEAGVWITGFGHGGELSEPLASRTKAFTRIVGLHSGKSAGDSLCPLDEGYMADYLNFVRRVCEQNPTLLMIDDDLRLSSHGAVDIGCACPLHLAELSRRLGRPVSREELATQVFTGKPNELRALWLDVMRDTMLTFGRRVREAVDSVNPSIRAGQCACLTTWDADGADAIELSRALAGGTRPFMRLIGAAYWNSAHSLGSVNLGSIVEIERTQLAWCREYAPDIEVFTEGDVYPRPRYVVPAAFVEGFDQALLADGTPDGILKYMLDYRRKPLYETGYIDRHLHNAPLRDAIAKAFTGRAVGVYCFEPMHIDGQRDCTGLAPVHIQQEIARPSAKLCALCSIPAAYERDGKSAAIVFGGAANHADEYFTTVPLILDAVSAEILGGEVSGMISREPLGGVSDEEFGGESIPASGVRGLCAVKLAEGAQVLSWWIAGGEHYPAVWRYVNGRGQRVLGYAFDAVQAVGRSQLFLSYERQRQLAESIEWLQGYPLPAHLSHNTDLYLLCRRDGGKLVVGLWNFGIDEVLPGRVKLDKAYRKLTPIGKVPLHLEGGAVQLDDVIPPYAFAGFEVIE